ncbi:MAG: 5-oxoprolinase subunit B family protein [Nocardioides sp.]
MSLALRDLGRDAVLAEVANTSTALALAQWARGHDVAAEEIVPGARTVLFDGTDPAALRDVLAGFEPGEAGEPGPLVEVPVTYDGPDLAFVAQAWGCSEDEVADRLEALELVSAFCGFAPGFAYLSGLPDQMTVPRLDRPRTRVPAGSVALADTWCGVYPVASPGGWRLIGRTDLAVWDATRRDPALLAPGVRVRFRDASSLGSSTQGFRDASSLGSSTQGFRDASSLGSSTQGFVPR